MKKVITIAGAVICAAILCCNISLNKENKTGNISLSKVITANEANAECVYDDNEALNFGGCVANECFFYASGRTPCNPYVYSPL
jgi:hypothetical protein